MNFKEYLNSKDLKDCCVFTDLNSMFIKLFGFEIDKYDSKCILINKSSEQNEPKNLYRSLKVC